MKGKTPAGTVMLQPVSTLDLYTTFLKLGGYTFTKDHPLNGRDIRHLITGEEGPEIKEAPFFYYGPKELHAVRKGPWKLHVKTSSQTGRDYFEGKLPLLFNLAEDPSEQYDLSDLYPDKVEALLKVIQEQQASERVNGNDSR